MNNRNNVLRTAVVFLLQAFVFSSLSFADVGEVISITADAANSTSAKISVTSVDYLLNDPFAYDPADPTSTSPVQNWNPDGGVCFHATETEGVDVILSFVLDTPFTNRFAFSEVVVDMWGRNDCCQDRDDDVDVILYNGDYSTVVATIEGLAVPDSSPQHLGAIFDTLEVGVVFDRFQIIGHDSLPDNGSNNFTLFEVRLGVITPYVWTGQANDGDWSNTLNWVANTLPLDGDEGDGDNTGLNVYYKDVIVFAGDNLPTTNFPGIGGNYPDVDRDTPTMVLKSGGATTFNVAGRETGFWINTYTDRTVLEIGDGIGGGSEDVDLTLTGPSAIDLNRHVGSITQSILVNSDGSLRFDADLMLSYNDTRYGTIIIDGGDVDVNGSVRNIRGIDGNYVEFISTNGAFTAEFGENFGALTVVRDSLEKDFVMGSGLSNYHLRAVDNGDSTFTVTPGVYCWTGAANDGNWSNASNWVEGNIPVDNEPGTGNADGLTMAFNEFIVFDGSNMPMVNVPEFGGTNLPEMDTPTLKLKRGGSFIMSVTGYGDGFWTNLQRDRTVVVVGDGVSGGIEDVTLVITNMTGSFNRHVGGG